MKLSKINYSQFDKKKDFWKLSEFTLGEINLIVGKNSTGKSRTLSVINSLAMLISQIENLIFISGNYDVEFSDNGEKIKYLLHYENKKVLKEQLFINDEKFLDRSSDGTGEIWTKQIDGYLNFSIATDKIAAHTRRDQLQHPFLEKLFEWGTNVRHYRFGGTFGQDLFPMSLTPLKEKEENKRIRNDIMVIETFKLGIDKFNDVFKNVLIQDLSMIGYDIEDVNLEKQREMVITKGNIDTIPYGLAVKEKGLRASTTQISMSQGMFRTLAVLINLNYSLLNKEASCILIDDVGEGLDYKRSSSIIQLIIDKAKNSNVQLIMATNDQFIMNKVPLEYWIILERENEKVMNYSYRNSKEIFEEFDLTGLNNFDLFSSNYYLKGKA